MSEWLAFFAAAGAVWMDLRMQKVRNWFILAGLAAGFIYHLAAEGLRGMIEFSAGVFCPVLLLAVLFLAGALGAGDIKLFAVLGGIMGRCCSACYGRFCLEAHCQLSFFCPMEGSSDVLHISCSIFNRYLLQNRYARIGRINFTDHIFTSLFPCL